MTKSAEKHLAAARAYVAKGETFYRKAAEEIVAAQKADPTLGTREIGAWFGRSYDWVQKLVLWHTSDSPDAPFGGELARERRDRSAAKKVLREAKPEQLAEIMSDLPAARRAAVVRAAVPPPERTTSVRTDPSFIGLIVRVTSALIELEAMVGGWQNPAAIPPEFSRGSFNDVVAKVLRIQDRFDELVAAIDNDDDDEFLKIVRNFRETSDVG